MAYHKKPRNEDDDLEDLLRKADQVLGETPPEEAEEDAPPAPWEDLRFYANYSNHYGQDVRNYQNNYGRPNEPRPEAQEETPGPAIPAYNVDFQNEDRRQPRRQSPRKNHRETYEEGEDLPRRPAPSRQPKPSKRRKKRRGVRLLAGVLLVVLLLIGGAYLWIRSTMKMPETDQPIGARKEGAATVLLCGTDQEGTRTDTMMLLYLNAREQAITLVSLPRDTLTHTSSGSDAKLNSAYGRNDGGQEGMEALLDYVSDIIGYRPDGYMLITLDAFVDVVNLMGGVEFDVPMDMFYEDPSQDLYIDLKEGKQKLDGYEAMGLVRFRKGYADQDLGRVDVQRQFLSACMDQWLTLPNLVKLPQILSTVQASSESDLTTGNLLWIAYTAWRSGLGNLQTVTLPGYADMIDGVSYYILDPAGVADVINQSCNPYTREINANDLNIVY